jgi:hypothetical protein
MVVETRSLTAKRNDNDDDEEEEEKSLPANLTSVSVQCLVIIPYYSIPYYTMLYYITLCYIILCVKEYSLR